MDDLLKNEDFTSEEETKACEQILDNFLEQDATKTTILDTAWEETFNDLFPDIGECTF